MNAAMNHDSYSDDYPSRDSYTDSAADCDTYGYTDSNANGNPAGSGTGH